MQTAIKIFLPIICFFALISKFNFDLSPRGIVFCVLFAVWGVYFVKTIIFSKNFEVKTVNFVLILTILLFKLLNNLLIHSYTFENILFFFGLYLTAEIFSSKKRNFKFFWLTVLTTLFLPIKEYIQIFIGTPMRFLSAEIISKILNLTGFSNLTQSSVLIFENNITDIGYSCSGSSTFWVILVFISLISLFLNIKFSKKIIYLSIFSLLTLFCLNTSRILILTVLYNAFPIKENILSTVHIGLGIINFLILFCIIVYCLFKLPKKIIQPKYILNKNFIFILILLGIVFIPINLFFKNFYSEQTSQIKLSDGMKISKEEAKFFTDHNGSIEKSKENNVIKIKVNTDNWRTHHNPINCIKGSGYKILKTKTLVLNNKFIKEVQTDKGYIYFFFSNNEITTDDYYKRVFYSFFQKNKKWTLYEYSSKTPLNIKYFEKEL